MDCNLRMDKTDKKFYPQLDSLRAFAVLLVIISHWFSPNHFFSRYTQNGTLGVTLFFVLSGFLITGILLRNKATIENGGDITKAYRIFYIRRSLRIFPVYYLLLIFLLVFNISEISKSFWWHFFYCSNFYYWLQGHFSGLSSHFWSLAVEEQFYLFWPAVIFIIPLRHLVPTFIIGVFVAYLFRYGITTPENDLGRFLMPGSLDSFCIGGLFAYARFILPDWYKKYIQIRWLFVLLSFMLLAAVHSPLYKNLHSSFTNNFYISIISIVFGIWIDRVADGVNRQPFALLLNNKIFMYIGKISYGMYLFHNFMPYFYGLKLPGTSQDMPAIIVEALRFISLILLSTLSWYFFERPILRLKKYFNADAIISVV